MVFLDVEHTINGCSDGKQPTIDTTLPCDDCTLMNSVVDAVELVEDDRCASLHVVYLIYLRIVCTGREGETL